MKIRHLHLIICPECGEKFNISDSSVKGDEIELGSLKCDNGHNFAITNGIPRLLPMEINEEQKKTADSFGQKWNTDSVKQYGFDGEVLKFHHNWYLQRYGWPCEKTFKKFLGKQEYILDAGCGAGRDVKWFSESCNGMVIGIDISSSIDVARNNLRECDNVLLIQCDLSKLPFAEDFFTFISCDQVIHHSANTENSFNHLVNHLCKGGVFSTYTYKNKGPIREFCDDFIREKTTNMSYEECYKFSKQMTLLGKAFAELSANVEIPVDIPLLNIKKGRVDMQRFLYWNVFKCFWNEDHGLESSIMTNFDWYHPKIAHRHSPDELKKWVADNKLQTLFFDVGDAGISVRLKK